MTAAIRRKNLVHKLQRNWKQVRQIFDEQSKLRKKGPVSLKSISNQTLRALEAMLETLEKTNEV
jgi:hypothetical protein